MDSFNQLGIWWLPDKEDDYLTGTLSFSVQEGIKLVIVGSFSEIADAFASLSRMDSGSEYVKFPRIYGILENGDRVTLANSVEVDPGVAFGKIPRQKFQGGMAYMGRVHITTENLLFTRTYLEFSHMLDWAGRTAFREQRTGPRDYILTQSLPDDIILPCGEITISIQHRMDMQSRSRSRSYQEQAVCKIESQEGLSIEGWLSRYIRPIQDLFTLATDRPNPVLKLTAYCPYPMVDNEQEEGDAHRYFNIVYRPLFHKTYEEDWISPQEMSFTFADLNKLGKEPSDLFIKWLGNVGKFNDVCNLYFNTRYNPPVYGEARFLNLAQAIEIYHRIKYKRQSKLLPNKEFKVLKEKLLACVPDADAYEQIRTAIPMLNTKRLRQMVEDIYDRTRRIIGQLYPDKGAFAKRVTDTRNFYTHYNREKEGAKGTELYFLTEALEYMLIPCLLYELGFDDDQVVDLLERNNKFQYRKKQIGAFLSRSAPA